MMNSLNKYQQPSNIKINWDNLSDKQKEELYNQSLIERNLKMIEFCYWGKTNENDKNQKTIPNDLEKSKWIIGNKTLIDVIRKGDIELLKWLIYDCPSNQEPNSNDYRIDIIEQLITNWAVEYECLEILYKINLDKVSIIQYNNLLNTCLYAGHITIENRINNKNPIYQYILDDLKSRNMDLLNRLETVLIGAIRFREKNPGLLELVYDNYLSDNNFLKHCIIQKVNLKLVKKKKQYFMNYALDEATIYSAKYDIIDYLVKKGANLKNRNGEIIVKILKKNYFHYIDIITNAGIDIGDYKKKALKYTLEIDLKLKEFNNVGIEYLINLFEDKKEAWKIIKKYETRENVANSWKIYIDNIILEKKLRKELNLKKEIKQMKL